MSHHGPFFGCIEAGGTKFNVGLASRADHLLDSIRIDTTTPEETIGATIAWLSAAALKHGSLAGVGIASFGPVELDPASPHWGNITETTKPGWSHTDFARRIGRTLGVPVGFDTDVNGAAIAEARWGAGLGQPLSVYVTIGTGLGGGIVIDGKPLHGLSHPEMGHFRVDRHPADRAFVGSCPFHGACLEGLASGPSIIARWGKSLSELPADHIGHEIIAHYLAQLCVALQAMMEPGRIILGGGVMGTPGLLARVRAGAQNLSGGYFKGQAETIIVAPGLGDKSGLWGALALAMDAAS